MTTRRVSRWVAGWSVCFAILVLSSPNRAADTQDVKWETQRTSQPEDIPELKALEARVKSVVDKCTPSTVAILIGVGAGSGVIVNEDGLVLTPPTSSRASRGWVPPTKPGKECTIILRDGKRVKGKTLGINDRTDSGMVQIIDKGPKDGKWPFTPIAKSADVKKGQWVVSLGHPGGPKSGRAPVARLGRVGTGPEDRLAPRVHGVELHARGRRLRRAAVRPRRQGHRHPQPHRPVAGHEHPRPLRPVQGRVGQARRRRGHRPAGEDRRRASVSCSPRTRRTTPGS